MSAVRVATWALGLLLAVGPPLGFAAGDQALQIWNKHPRHASSEVGAPHAASKTAQAAATPARPAPSFSHARTFFAEAPLATSSPGLRPPFVPPRV
jgi:hypothetical protein